MTNFPSVAVVAAFYVLGALSLSLPVVTPRPQLNASVDEHDLLRQRAITTEMSTCGYENGDPTLIRTANSGYDCRVDTVRALWGFCPTTVISASDCGLAGYCVDTGSCSDGCGSLSGVSTITTFTWCVSGVPALSCDATNSKISTDSDASFCSTALLTFGVDQTYSYIACGATAVTQHYDITPTTSTSATTTSDTSSSSNSQATSSISPSSGDLPSSSTASVESSSTASAAAEDSSSSDKGSSVNTGAIVGGVLGGIAIICVCVVAVVFLMKRGRGRGSPDTAQPQPEPQSPPPGVQPIENQESKSFMAYESGGTTREASFVSELPGSAQWPELSELAAGYDQHGQPK